MGVLSLNKRLPYSVCTGIVNKNTSKAWFAANRATNECLESTFNWRDTESMRCEAWSDVQWKIENPNMNVRYWAFDIFLWFGCGLSRKNTNPKWASDAIFIIFMLIPLCFPSDGCVKNRNSISTNRLCVCVRSRHIRVSILRVEVRLKSKYANWNENKFINSCANGICFASRCFGQSDAISLAFVVTQKWHNTNTKTHLCASKKLKADKS